MRGRGDPKVTGVLPVALNSATKVLTALLTAGKEYVAVMRLHEPVDEERVREVMAEFVGTIYQRPPLRSSVKRRVRKRRIYYLDVLEVDGQDVLFRVGCEAGVYVRKICFDVGEVLGCGAHMRELRRTRAGPFVEDECATMHDLVEAVMAWREDGDERLIRNVVKPMEKALDHLPKIYIRDSAVDAVCHGAHLAAPGVLSVETGITPGGLVAVMTQKGEAVALAKALMTSEQIVEAQHGLVAKTERVLMPRGVYPRMWRTRG